MTNPILQAGVDGGGTGSRCVIVDLQGAELAWADGEAALVDPAHPLRAARAIAGAVTRAAQEAGGPIAIVLPARGVAAGSDDGLRLEGLMRFGSSRLRGRNGAGPASVRAMEPVMAGPEVVGYVMALRREDEDGLAVALDIGEVVRQAALAAVTEIAVADARDEVTDEFVRHIGDDVFAGHPETGAEEAHRLEETIGHRLHSTLGINVKVSLAAPRETPRSEGGKLRRVVDQRAL